ncbi:dTDP-4-dehydrorhamnose reductase [Dasania marina]|uniref:dTDP-4-dehydrorhamnose reductase n=1 Tax=Dasania marina TaxID=471499 RepID=UPI0030D795BD|tara:strand:- start:38934 stop:39809 length:876 start_codon:yes stop_codon:yes gene_type:complete
MKTIAVIGKNGQLASELAQLKADNVEIMTFGRDDIDVFSVKILLDTFRLHQINAVINACAYTEVDLAETEPERAYLMNAQAVENLAQACKQLSLHLVHVSTDYVFSGDKGRPYLPNDTISPMGVYGKSKAEGEKYVKNILDHKGCIIRTSWVYSVHGKNFVKTMINLMGVKSELGVVSDQVGTPTSAKNLAQVCFLAAINNVSGIHHYTDAGVASWYDFAVTIQSISYKYGLLDKEIVINPINTEDYPASAKRPFYSVLDKKSLYKALPDLIVMHWECALNETIKSLAPST